MLKYNVIVIENHKEKRIMQTTNVVKAINKTMELKQEGKRAHYRIIKSRTKE